MPFPQLKSMLLRITDDGIAAEYHEQQTGPARGEVGSSGCYGSCGEQFGESANELAGIPVSTFTNKYFEI